MTEERTIQFTCPVCKSGWGAKASMAGQRKTCPKCHTEIIVPSPPPGGAAPTITPAPKATPPMRTAPAGGKKSASRPLLLLIGIPAAVAVAAVVIGIMIANSDRGADQPKTEAAGANANPAAPPVTQEVPAKKEEPQGEDPKWMQFVENYLKANENKYTITKKYPSEPLAGAYYHVGGKDDGTWIPIDRRPRRPRRCRRLRYPPRRPKNWRNCRKPRSIR